jgi:dTDP-3-amino-3,4,6-trideoxy-alpha-D-glucose transaminase
VIRHPRARELEGALREAGIGVKGYYRVPVHRQPAMAEWGAGASLPATDELADTHLAIPMSPVLDAAQAGEVVAAVAGARLG